MTKIGTGNQVLGSHDLDATRVPATRPATARDLRAGRRGLRLVAGVALGTLAAAGVAQRAEARPRVDRSLDDNPLVLTSFLQDGRTDVRRNEPLTFRFSANVKKGSVDERSLRVLEVSSNGLRNAVGARIVQGNTITFDPTRTQRNYDDSRRPNSQVTEKDNPLGFGSYVDFQVQLPAPPEFRTLKNVVGGRITQGYTSNFRTNDLYDDPVSGQPTFVGVSFSGQLGFDPPRSGATGLVDEDAIIILEFSEPVRLDSVDPGVTVIVKRITVNEDVPGFVRLDPADRSGRRFHFVPSLGFGSDEANKSGWDISVELTQGITDLAGNSLKRPFVAQAFRTRYVPGKPSSSIIAETFNNQLKMDAATTADGGEWNTVERGALRGGVPTTYAPVDVIYTAASTGGTPIVRTRVNDPLVSGQQIGSSCFSRPQGARVQMLYVPADVGIAAAIVSMGWGPSSNALFAANHPGIALQLGHTSQNALTADFAGNVNVGNLSPVYSGNYDIPQAKNVQPSDQPQTAAGVTNDPNAKGFWSWPVFSTPFEWNGVNNLVFDAAVQPGNNCQILRIGFVPAGFSFPNRRSVGSNYAGETGNLFTEPVVYDARFNKRRRTTIATSQFYELASDNPVFAAPVVSPVGQSGGVSVIVEMEGAHGKPDPLRPGAFIPNTTTSTGWTTDVTIVNGHRFMRFRVLMTANLTTNQTARISSIQFPYQF